MIHQSWKSRKLPTRRAQRWSASWQTCFPNWEFRFWTDDDKLALVRDHYPWFLPVYFSFKKPVERADVARYFYMFHFGGIYADLDAVCQKNFEHLLNSTAMLFGGMDGLKQEDSLLRTYVENSLMASRPGHPFWMRLIARVMVHQHFGRGGGQWTLPPGLRF
ncbi:hypothetical protein BOX15_Mlig032152g3 [Macrostomum lignano]|uniref:Uncharacterized protein n=1 Tax=Macrostomum lignano TaxID=282301 RepID=A0A267FQY8_9PLAT|nr:hypothetical protein BOX15_Mlig032152g3 [Macrostomum lignano]